MDDSAKSRVERFLNDKALSQTVYNVLRDSFLKARGQRDVQMLAAERLAVDLLDGGWRALESLKNEVINKSEAGGQIGM